MTKVQVLGTGCAKCEKLAENAAAAIEQLSLDAQIEKVTDINDIINFGVMATPALAVDGEVKVVGKVATTDEIKEILS